MRGLPDNWDVMWRDPQLRETVRGMRKVYMAIGLALAAGVFYLVFVQFGPSEPVVSLDSPSPALRIDAIRDCTDQAKLGNLALNDPDKEVRLAAVLKVFDSVILTQVIEQEEEGRIAVVAAGRLGNPGLMRQAMQRRNARIREGLLQER